MPHPFVLPHFSSLSFLDGMPAHAFLPPPLPSTFPLVCSSTFPVNSLTLSFPYLEKTFTIDGYTPPASLAPTPLASYGTAKAADTPELNINLSTALQYGGSGGAAPLVKFMKEHVRRQFAIPYE